MKAIKDETLLQTQLAAIDNKMAVLNSDKILAFFKAIGLTDNDIPKEYTEWETILIVVPTRTAMQELKPYKFSISGIAFAINVNAEKIHLYNLEEWKTAFRHKTTMQIRNLLKTSFGGVKKTTEDFNKEV
jgi:hypothetical protein